MALEAKSLPAIFRLSVKDCFSDFPDNLSLAIFTPVLNAVLPRAKAPFLGLEEPFS